MESLFDQITYFKTKARIRTLTLNDTPSWGKMDVAQMVTHCQFPLKIALSNTSRSRSKNPIPLLLKKAMYSDKPWLKNLPTAPQAKIKNERDLTIERDKLLSMVDAFYAKRNQTEWLPHPMFGNFTPDQWGKMQYKHLDHHLAQFKA